MQKAGDTAGYQTIPKTVREDMYVAEPFRSTPFLTMSRPDDDVTVYMGHLVSASIVRRLCTCATFFDGVLCHFYSFDVQSSAAAYNH